MTRIEPTGSELPHSIYPIARWAITEERFEPSLNPLLETVFALGNGWLGIRGSFHQGRPAHQPGALINGFYESWPIMYPESAYGFATAGQTIVYVPDPTIVQLSVDGEEIDLTSDAVTEWQRKLDLKRGILTHSYTWTTPDGATVRIVATRFVSIVRHDLIVCRLSVTANRPVSVGVESSIVNRQDTDYLEPAASEFDPRRAKNFGRRVLEPTYVLGKDELVSLAYKTVQSHQHVALSSVHAIHPVAEIETLSHPDHATRSFDLQIAANETATIDTFTVFATGEDRGADLTEPAARTAAETGVTALQSSHVQGWASFWKRADIHIGTDKAVQQAVRWILLQLHQASAQGPEVAGIAAKGVTGQAYEGHYFWDTEVFVLPFLTYTNPAQAARLLRFRHAMLPQARERAGEMALSGALFPWRTIDGREASAYYAAGTAQYHINADIAYALRKYVEVSGDVDLLWDVGVEMLIETARMWADLGFHRDGAFHIYGVTGPDEYTAIVDDNAYTNLMAQMNLEYAVESVERMRAAEPARFRDLAAALNWDDSEMEEWHRAATDMYVPFDSGFDITMQDESFLAKEHWDFENIPAEKYPLLLHFHPLVIYRYQVLKQADVVMAMFLRPELFDRTLMESNFHYYDPLTTGDSSLSACVQSVIAARIGESELAMRYFRTALFTDLGDLHGNTTDGVHLASSGGVWMALMYGMAGLDDLGGDISFDPHVPEDWRRMAFTLSVRGVDLEVEIDHHRIVLQTGGGNLDVWVRGTRHAVGSKAISVGLSGT